MVISFGDSDSRVSNRNLNHAKALGYLEVLMMLVALEVLNLFNKPTSDGDCPSIRCKLECIALQVE